MAIVNAAVLTTDTTLLTVPAGKKYALTTLLVCNTGQDDGTGRQDFTITDTWEGTHSSGSGSIE